MVRQIYQDAYEEAVEKSRREGYDLDKLAAELEARERGDD
jgi:hypothetical protein